MKQIFVSGIGTGIGKTFACAVLCQALKADYWKPIQAGSLEHTDSDIVSQLVDNTVTKIHPETFRLKTACSPHLAAKLDNVVIRSSQLIIPKTKQSLVIEGAGGLLVPLNEQELVIDLIAKFQIPVLLVSKNYLGSINHTLLSIEALRARSIPVLGIIMNGAENFESEKIIYQFGKIPILGRLQEEKNITKEVVRKYAAQLEGKLNELI